jgi:hypothetical protein
MTKHIIIVEASKCAKIGDPDFSFHKDGEITPYILEKFTLAGVLGHQKQGNSLMTCLNTSE